MKRLRKISILLLMLAMLSQTTACAASTPALADTPPGAGCAGATADPCGAYAPPGPGPAAAPGGGRVLVAYFSATGNTRLVAEKVAEATGGDLFEIVPERPYSAADLDYSTDCRANAEQNDPDARPAIAGAVEDMGQYDVVLIG